MKDRLGKIFSLFGPFLGLAVVYALFLVIAPPSFHSLYNTKTFLTQAVIYGIGALGMTVVIISGGIDLSVGSMVALGTVVTALVLKAPEGAPVPGFGPPVWAALAAIGACAFCGLVNGALVSLLRIVPFIVTLGTMQIVRGLAKGLAKESTVNAPENWLNNLMLVEPQSGVWHSVAPGLWILLGLAVLLGAVLKYTVFGRHVYAIGSNEATARLCGIRVGLQRVWIYTLGGALAGVASVMQFSNLTLGDPTAAGGMELDIIAAVVIGGGSLSGGEGSVAGSVLGAFLMAVLRNGCNLVGIPNYVQNIVIGAIIIAAVGVDRLRQRASWRTV
jgi:ribose/xylose/arabinose/galactoside ABC-type transport system permease subunit